MRISMWMLADWLKSYAPVARIEQGSRVLRNARLYSEELKISRSSVYLHQVEDSRVLCTNGHDVLELRSQDVNAVLGDTMDAFEYYNENIDELSVMPGRYQILYGTSSLDKDLQSFDFTVK